MPGKKFFLKILINTLIGVALIIVWSRFVNLPQIFALLKGARLEFAGLFFLFFILGGFFRGCRLKLLLKGHKIALKDLVMLNFLSQFLSFMIPIRAGEITKSVYLTSELGVPLGKTITWVFVDRALDMIGILIFIALLLPIVPTNLPSNFSQIVVTVLIFFFVLFVISIKSKDLFKKSMVFLSNFLIIRGLKRYFVSFTHTIIEGLEVLQRNPLELLSFMLVTMIALLFDSLAWMAAFVAVGVNLNFAQIILGNGLEAFTFLIPAAPGYVGSAEAAGLAVWSVVLGLGADLASASVIFFHILTMLALLILGVLAIYLLKFDLGMVWKKLFKKGD